MTFKKLSVVDLNKDVHPAKGKNDKGTDKNTHPLNKNVNQLDKRPQKKNKDIFYK